MVRPAGPASIPLKLRDAAADDADRLAKLDGRLSPSPWSSGRFADYCKGENKSAGAKILEQDQHIIGYAVYHFVLDEGTLLQIGVERAHRGCGYGKQLLESVLQELLSAGIKRCLLEVRASNAVAIAFYRHRGFVIDGKRKDYYLMEDGREDAVLMSLNLVDDGR